MRDVAAIPSMERVLGPAAPQLALAAVDSLKANQEQRATEGLIRFAVFSSDDSVQKAACDALRCRRFDTYVPLLLAGLRMPVSGEYIRLNLDDSSYVSRQFIFQEGPFGSDLSIQDRSITFTSRGQSVRIPSLRSAPRALSGVTDALQSMEQTSFERRIASTNAVNSVTNERIASVLANVTNQDLGTNPSDWWNWWFDQNEYQPQEKVTTVTTSRTASTVRCSCFVRGTPVWTSTGPMAIEKIKPGETVLSQDPQTGELAYKPVLATTNRPPSPVVEVNLGASTIRGTRGHPYWVSGEGWRMAKQLKAGQMLHTVNGPVRIKSAQQIDAEECFNLIVADFNTYFVGDAKVLVHDNTLRSPNTIRVPGLQE